LFNGRFDVDADDRRRRIFLRFRRGARPPAEVEAEVKAYVAEAA
jgi:hypothetical protein